MLNNKKINCKTTKKEYKIEVNYYTKTKKKEKFMQATIRTEFENPLDNTYMNRVRIEGKSVKINNKEGKLIKAFCISFIYEEDIKKQL